MGEEETVAGSNYRRALSRFFSVDSNINVADVENTAENYNYCSREFLMKVAQLVTGSICVGLFVHGIKITADPCPLACFPNVVFSSYIIINSVIIMSYMFGAVMPDILIRAFMSIAMILYFISATVCITIWCSKKVTKSELHLAKVLLLMQALLSYLNCILYGLDLFYNIRRAIRI